MMPRYPPTVTIGGRVIPNSWDGSGLVAVDALTFVWGRADLTDQPKATDMAAQLIDLDGSWASSPTLYGAAVTVTTALTTVFRGTIDGISLTPTTIRNATTGRSQPAYRVTLSAVDVTAEFEKLFPPGPGAGAFENDQYGAQHHPLRSRSALATFVRSASSVLVAAVNLYTGDAQSTNYVYARRDADSNVSLAAFIRNLYGSHALSWINYDPGTNAVDHGQITPITPRNLTYTNGIVALTGTGIHTVPGDQIDARDGAILLGLQENISAVVHTYSGLVAGPQVAYNGTNSNTTEMAPRSYTSDSQYLASVQGSNVHEMNCGMLQWSNFTSPSQASINTAFRFSQLNGQLRAPGMRFDLERNDYGSALETIFLSTKTTMESLYITGTLYAKLAGFLPHFQIIGGSLSYQGGWTFEPNMAPTRNPKLGTLTVAQLVTTDTPTMSQFDPDLCLADLGNLDTGVTT